MKQCTCCFITFVDACNLSLAKVLKLTLGIILRSVTDVDNEATVAGNDVAVDDRVQAASEGVARHVCNKVHVDASHFVANIAGILLLPPKLLLVHPELVGDVIHVPEIMMYKMYDV